MAAALGEPYPVRLGLDRRGDCYVRTGDVVTRLELTFVLDADYARTVPLPDDFLSSTLLSQVSVEASQGGTRLIQLPAWALLDRLRTASSQLETSDDAGIFDYAALSAEQKLDVTRRGFRITLLDVLLGVPLYSGGRPRITVDRMYSCFPIRVLHNAVTAWTCDFVAA